MKATDFSIIFCIIFMAFYLTCHIGNQASESVLFTAAQLNNIMDEIVIDAMEEGYGGVDGKLYPVMDRDRLIQAFIRESSIMLEGNYVEHYIPAFVKKIIYVQENGYFVFHQGKWSSKIIFHTDKHEEKVNMIIRSFTRAINDGMETGTYQINIPVNQGETFSQTISEYSFLIICEDLVFQMNGKEYNRYFLSGAKLKKKSDN